MNLDRRAFIAKSLCSVLLASIRASRADDAPAVNLAVDASAGGYDFSAVRKLLADAVEQNTLPGCSLLLMHNDKVIFKEAWGWANLATKQPFTLDTICRLASTTKWVTGATLAAAAEDGKLSLDDPIGKYYPEFKDLAIPNSTAKGNPTLRQCFSQTAGFPANVASMSNNTITLQESAHRIAKDMTALRAAPGTDYLYGNVSMQVAGAVTELVVGKPYEQYMRERLLDPLGMANSSFMPTAEQIQRIATVYQPAAGDGLAVMLPPQQTHQLPVRPIIAGGMYSTLDDYARFLLMNRHDGALAGKRLLKAVTVGEIVKDQTKGVPVTQTPYLTQKGYGLGVAIVETNAQGQPTTIADGGAFGTHAWIDYKTDLLAVFFTAMQLRPIVRMVQLDIPAACRAAVLSKAK